VGTGKRRKRKKRPKHELYFGHEEKKQLSFPSVLTPRRTAEDCRWGRSPDFRHVRLSAGFLLALPSHSIRSSGAKARSFRLQWRGPRRFCTGLPYTTNVRGLLIHSGSAVVKRRDPLLTTGREILTNHVWMMQAPAIAKRRARLALVAPNESGIHRASSIPCSPLTFDQAPHQHTITRSFWQSVRDRRRFALRSRPHRCVPRATPSAHRCDSRR